MKTKQTCFITIPFTSPFDLYYETIYKPAIKAADLVPVRADDLFRPSVIVADFWKMIQDAAVLLAELTTKNANVFYELGLSHAIGKPVVLISETMADVPFDLQQLRVILYDKDDPAWGHKLGNEITASLKETLESPIEAIPTIFSKKIEIHVPEQSILQARLNDLDQKIRRLEYTLARPRPTISHEDHRSIASMVHRIEMAREELSESTTVGEMEAWLDKWESKGLPRDILNEVVAFRYISGS